MPEQLMPQLAMRRENVLDLPPLLLPEGYILRPSREGDAHYWVTILNESFNNAWTDDDFDRIMVQDPAYSPDRILFICAPDGVPCAVAAAYRTKENPENGYLHYVGCRPCHAGKKLGMLVSLACLYKFREEGCDAVTLQTDDFRLAAIKTYLRLGFHPVIVHENQHERWKAIFAMLGILK